MEWTLGNVAYAAGCFGLLVGFITGISLMANPIGQLKKKLESAEYALKKLRADILEVQRYCSYEFPPVEDVCRRFVALTFLYDGKSVDDSERSRTGDIEQFRNFLRTAYPSAEESRQNVPLLRLDALRVKQLADRIMESKLPSYQIMDGKKPIMLTTSPRESYIDFAQRIIQAQHSINNKHHKALKTLAKRKSHGKRASQPQ